MKYLTKIKVSSGNRLITNKKFSPLPFVIGLKFSGWYSERNKKEANGIMKSGWN